MATSPREGLQRGGRTRTGGACVVFPEVWPDCLPAGWLWWLKNCLPARFISFSLKKKNMEGGLCSDRGRCAFGGKQTHYIRSDIWSANMDLCTRGSSKQKLNHVFLWCYPLISYWPMLSPKARLLTAFDHVMDDLTCRLEVCGLR